MRKIINIKNSIMIVLLFFLLFSFQSQANEPIQINKVLEPKTIKVGFFEFDGYHVINEEGKKEGYGYEYLQHMLVYNNWIYEYVGYDRSWSDMLEMLDRGEIDILTSAQKTDERMKKYDFSNEPIGSSSIIFSVEAGNNKYMAGDYENFNGMRVGMITGNSRNGTFAEFAKEKGFSFVPVYYDQINTMVHALHDHDEVDAIVTSSLRSVKDEWVLAEFAPSDYYAIVKKGNKELMEEINFAIDQIHTYSSELQMQLDDKYYSPDNGNEIPFTAEEREYIRSMNEQGEVFSALISADRYPLSGNIKGEETGIMLDILNEIMAQSGLNYNVIMPKSRQEYHDMVNRGEADIILDHFCDYNNAEGNGYKLSTPYLTVNLSQIKRKGNSSPIKTVAAIKYGDITEQFVESRYSADRIIYYNSVEECVKAVVQGKADAAYLYTYMAQYLINQNPYYKLTETLIPEYQAQFSIGIRYIEDARLLSILDKTASSMDKQYIQSIILADEYQPKKEFSIITYLYDNPILSIGTIAVLFIMILSWILVAVKQRNIKKEQERFNEFQRFVSYVCKMNDMVLEINMEEEIVFLYEIKNGEIVMTENKEGKLLQIEENFLEEDHERIGKIFSRSALYNLVDDTGEVYFECKVKTEDGSYRWYAYTLQGLVKDESHPRNFMLYKHDVDALKKDEELKQQILRDALNAAQQANETKSNFMSRMSHEMRTPLNGIIGYMTIAIEENKNTERIKENIRKAQDAARHLLAIINDVLDMASIESGKIKIANDSFNLKQELDAVSQLFGSQAAKKNVLFKTVYKKISVENILGDKLRVNQVLYNLLSNAVKFTPEGGAVTLTVEQRSKAEDKVFFCFTVSDTGIGMNKKYMENLFMPFEQQDSGISQKYGGTGLGLSITKNLIMLMDGEIDVRSEEGKGSTFIVEFSFGLNSENFEEEVTKSSIDYEEEGETEFSVLKSKYCFTGKRILLAEDNEMNMEIAVELLSQFGIKIDSAENGAIAVETFLHSRPGQYDAILMDIQMPVMNGYEATRQIRICEHPQAAAIPIFAMTADAFSSDVSKAFSAGMDGHISKPLEMGKLLSLLAKHML